MVYKYYQVFVCLLFVNFLFFDYALSAENKTVNGIDVGKEDADIMKKVSMLLLYDDAGSEDPEISSQSVEKADSTLSRIKNESRKLDINNSNLTPQVKEDFEDFIPSEKLGVKETLPQNNAIQKVGEWQSQSDGN